MKKIIFSCLIFLTVLFFSLAYAGGSEDQRINLSHKPGEGLTIEKLDLEIKPGATYVIQGVSDPNNAKGAQFSGAWRAELDVKKKFWEWGEAFVRLLAGGHKSVTNKINAFSNVDYNAHDSRGDISAHTFWYKQYLFKKQFTLALGKLDPTDWFDLNKYADNHRTQFLGDIFNNSPLIDWPVNYSFGVHMDAAPESAKFIQLAFDYLDADWKNIFQRSIFAWELNFRPAYLSGNGPVQRDGNYRLYGWLNNRPHAKLIQGGVSQADADNLNYGVGLSCDQMITDVFGLFSRLGWQRPDVANPENFATLEWMWTMGAQMKGEYWGRKFDALGMAVGQLFPSSEYKDAGHPAAAEGHAELYYNYKLNEYLALTPDLQFIWNPNGAAEHSQGGDGTVFVYGIRAQAYF